MSGRKSRNKGLNWERHIAKLFRELNLFPDARRNLEYQEGCGYDLENTGDWRFQLKRGKRHAPISKIKEIPEGDYRPALITKADRDKTYVVIEWDDFIHLLQIAKFEKLFRNKAFGLDDEV